MTSEKYEEFLFNFNRNIENSIELWKNEETKTFIFLVRNKTIAH